MNWFKKASLKDIAIQKIEELKLYLSKFINDQKTAQWRSDPYVLQSFRAITGLLINLAETVRNRNDFNYAQELSSKAVMNLYQICQDLTTKSRNTINFLFHEATQKFFDIEENLVSILKQATMENYKGY